MDAKGEVLITIMASLAQQEFRPIRPNHLHLPAKRKHPRPERAAGVDVNLCEKMVGSGWFKRKPVPEPIHHAAHERIITKQGHIHFRPIPTHRCQRLTVVFRIKISWSWNSRFVRQLGNIHLVNAEGADGRTVVCPANDIIPVTLPQG